MQLKHGVTMKYPAAKILDKKRRIESRAKQGFIEKTENKEAHVHFWTNWIGPGVLLDPRKMRRPQENSSERRLAGLLEGVFRL